MTLVGSWKESCLTDMESLGALCNIVFQLSVVDAGGWA